MAKQFGTPKSAPKSSSKPSSSSKTVVKSPIPVIEKSAVKTPAKTPAPTLSQLIAGDLNPGKTTISQSTKKVTTVTAPAAKGVSATVVAGKK